MESDGKTVMMLAANGTLSGLIAVADVIKETAKDGLAALKALGIEVVMITGDHALAARAHEQRIDIEFDDLRQIDQVVFVHFDEPQSLRGIAIEHAFHQRRLAGAARTGEQDVVGALAGDKLAGIL